MVDARLQGADDGHGADAEQDAGGDEALGKTAVAAAVKKLFLDGIPRVLDGVVDAQQLSDDGAQHHGKDHAEQLLRLNGAGDADDHRAEGQGLHQRVLEALLQAVAKEDAEKASHQHRCHIHKYRDHALFSLSLR